MQNAKIREFQEIKGESIDKDRFHEFNGNAKPVGVLDFEVVEYLKENYHMFVFGGNTLYTYKDGVYKEDDNGIIIKSKIQTLLYTRFIKASVLQRIYNLLLLEEELQKTWEDLNNQPKHWINFQNGYFDVIEWKLLDHSPQYLMINQIPHSYKGNMINADINAENIFMNYLNTTIPDEEDQEMLLQYMGYAMTMDTRFQKFLMLRGNGGTGKSVIISLVQALVGEKNTSNVELHNLDKRFYAASLFGKQLNACADLKNVTLKKVNILKQVVGEDTLMYEKKGKDPKFFRSYTKLLFSANEVPKNLEENTNAYYRRLLVLTMDYIIPQDRKDPELLNKLLKEIDVIIFRCLQALQRLYENNCFSESNASRKYIQQLSTLGTVSEFVNEHVEEASDSSLIKKKIVFQEYKNYCADNKVSGVSRNEFYKRLKELGIAEKKHNTLGYCYYGIKIVT